MRFRFLSLVCLILLASLFPGAARRDTVKQEMRFGAEAAQRGLWREAQFRWEKILKDDPDNARVHNNLAVAFENLGQFDRARKEYEDARRLAPDTKEIRKNQESFLELCRLVRSCRGEQQPVSGSDAAAPAALPHGTDAGPASPPAPGEAAPEPSPSPSGTPGGQGH